VGEVIKSVAPIFTAGAACSGAYIAYRGLTRWHDETVGKRRIELAEAVLADFYQACDIIKAARSRFGYSHEGLSRQKGETETEADTQLLNSYFAATERLMSKADFFAEMWAVAISLAPFSAPMLQGHTTTFSRSGMRSSSRFGRLFRRTDIA
jgi:hypothetical protein